VSFYVGLGGGSATETAPELRGRTRFRVFDEMRNSDPIVKSLLWAWKLPVRAAEWSVTAASEDEVDLAVADAVRWAFGLDGEPGHITGGFQHLLAQTLLYLDYGAMSGELVLDDPVIWRDADGDPHLIVPVWKVGRRLPHSVQRYIDPPPGSQDPLGGMVQAQAPKVVIPGERLLHTVLEPEVEPLTGVSLIRPCYGAWKLKRSLLVGSAVAFDRHAGGIPVVRYPTGGGPTAFARAQRIGRDLRNHERAYVALEGRADEGWDVDILSGAGSLADPVPLLRHYDEQIVSAGLAQVMRLGTSERGARAVGEVLAEPLFLAITSIAEQVANDLTDQLVRRFVRMNFGAVDVPRLTPSKISHRNIELVTRAMAELASAGMNFSDRATQDEMRDLLGLPDLPLAAEVVAEGEAPRPVTAGDAAARARQRAAAAARARTGAGTPAAPAEPA
jgi:hypothetical protein